ncbi:MAG: Rieske (2Fe-2S) protein [Deltaproteobacteria bacterium]|nr:Rieske (2Fe-2S) protein [Deltaproteobacteria bacterium]
MKWFKAALVSDLASGEGKTVEPVPGRPIALFNNHGTFQAIDNVCPHRGGFLSEGRLKENCVIWPLHQWTFDLKTGENIRNPQVKLRVYPVRVRGEDVWIEL